jgi:SOS-response transcriptional repressor LexA
MANFTELFGSEVLSEDVKSKLAEAWDAKVKENKTEALAELREEFSQRYEHDKSVMVEALDLFISENLQKELTKLKESKINMLKQQKIQAVQFQKLKKEQQVPYSLTLGLLIHSLTVLLTHACAY